MSAEAPLRRYVITVGPVPMRKGQWLGVQDGTSWVALAKFRSDQAADDFLALMAHQILAEHAHELAEKIRWREAPSDADQRFVAYVNGWCDGRNEAADEIDPEAIQ